jgi:predicted nucleotidyltransferase
MPAILAPDVQAVLDNFKQGIQDIYGPRLKGLILYGSRARGDAEPDSDVDVVVVLDGPIDRGAENERTSYLRAAINLDTGLLVSCLYLTPDKVRSGERLLYRNIRSEGIRL